MEIKQTILNPFGDREESSANGSPWSMGGGVIGSSGPVESVNVPMLIGLTASQAWEALESVGLIPRPSTRTDGATEGNDGTVASQDPLTNTLVNVGSTVSYAIFTYVGPDLATVPNIVGLTQQQAETAIYNAGLNVDVVSTSIEGATGSNWGSVKEQTPVAGTEVAQGSGVSFVTYQYESTATTGSIAYLTRNASSELGWSLNGDQAIMYVSGRENWPATGSNINVSGTMAPEYNSRYIVEESAPTSLTGFPFTALKVTFAEGGSFEALNSPGGTWTKAPTAGVVISPTSSWWSQGGTTHIENVDSTTASTIINGVAGYPGPWNILGNTYEIINSASYDSGTSVLTLNSGNPFFGSENNRGETSTTYPVGDPVITWEIWQPISVEVIYF
jgi:hypothetical protein